jgi:monovalent cation:proton antiporter-2 (CPA2) family protein
MGGLLFQAFIYLCAAVIAVPLAKRLGLGSVLGYLLAGIVIGPVIGLVGSETQQIQHFAEFGVVMMLFLVGLELHPGMLWEMRTRLLGLGGLQVFLTAGLIAGAAALFGLAWNTAIVIGLIFALSSTAIVLQTLNEKGLTRTDGGRASFSVLLFQDIAVIPMLAVIPLLALPEIAGEGLAGAAIEAAVHGAGDHHGDFSLVADLPGWAHTLVVLGAVAFVLFGGHFLSRPLFRIVAESRLREIFTASALFLVIGIALLMTLVELSPALGTFLAGVVLANSEFRHELESNVEPFKGLLLGLFFITVGAGIDFGILFEDFFMVLGLTLGVFLVKGLVLFGLARLFRLKPSDRWLMTLGLAQAGEFGFVLLSFSLQRNAIPADLASLLSLVVALSMLVTPVLFILYEKRIEPRLRTVVEQEPDAIEESGSVIVAGNGRFGQIVNRLLVASGISTVVLDHEPNMVDMLRKFGIKAYYGDASRPELLHAAGIEHARVLVVAICDPERSAALVKYVKSNYPHVKILARAHDVTHLYLLQNAGVDLAVREMFDGSLRLGSEALLALGFPPAQVDRMAQTFREHDHAGLDQLYHLWDENPDVANNKAFLALAREHAETLKSLMEVDRLDLPEHPETGNPPQPAGQGQSAE